jgi:hypothetical protein
VPGDFLNRDLSIVVLLLPHVMLQHTTFLARLLIVPVQPAYQVCPHALLLFRPVFLQLYHSNTHACISNVHMVSSVHFNALLHCCCCCLRCSAAPSLGTRTPATPSTITQHITLLLLHAATAAACSSITENSRACYPIHYISNARIPCVACHPSNIILLCCDAFGVLPPVSRLSLEQAMYHFVSGYTAKVAGASGFGVRFQGFTAGFGMALSSWPLCRPCVTLSAAAPQR